MSPERLTVSIQYLTCRRNNHVQGNFIGTDVTGTLSIGHTKEGVKIDLGAQNNTISGSGPGEGNFISGNGVIFTIWPGGKNSMAPYLVQWFVYSLVVGIFAAYVAGRALEAGAHYLAVFRFVGVTTFACYTIAGWQESIWYRRAWSVTVKNTLDGLFYALLTAGTFGWLWPR
jgi:hypothetical protein